MRSHTNNILRNLDVLEQEEQILHDHNQAYLKAKVQVDKLLLDESASERRLELWESIEDDRYDALEAQRRLVEQIQAWFAAEERASRAFQAELSRTRQEYQKDAEAPGIPARAASYC